MSATVTSASLPVACTCRTPMPRPRMSPYITWLMPPLWLTTATGPSFGSISMKRVEKFAIAPVPKLARPWVFGPAMRIPAARALGHRPLHGPALRARLAEARGEDHRDSHAPRGALVHSGDRGVAAHDDEHKLGHLRQRGERGIAPQPLDLGAVRIDRIDRAPE